MMKNQNQSNKIYNQKKNNQKFEGNRKKRNFV